MNPTGKKGSARSAGYDPTGEPTDAPVVIGDPQIGQHLAGALVATGDVERYTHGFHTYPAGLHPDAAAGLVRMVPARSLLDPFCGGGTVLVEGRAAGLRCVGRDVSPVALLVAEGRTTTMSDEGLTKARSTARKAVERARSANDLPTGRMRDALEQWYAPHAAMELESLRRSLLEADQDVQPLLWCCFSSILVKVSWRKSDTSSQRVKHRRPPGTTAILFHKKVRELARRVAELGDAMPPGTPQADLAREDARRLRLDEPVDLVVTSPPYPSTYDYLAVQHLRRVWMDLPFGEGEIASRASWREGERQARRQWLEDTRDWTQRVADVLAPGGHLVVVIGDGLTPTGHVDTSEPTEQAAKQAGLRSVARASVERVDHARESLRWEHAFAFQKPEEGAS